MNWFVKFLTSSIGQKIIMSLTGLFLIIFLVVHLVGNLQLLHGDKGEAFNTYAAFMTTNPIVKTVSYLLYFSILLHAVQGIILWARNRKARGPKNYAVKVTRTAGTSSTASRWMAALGTIILVFIILHMYQFWLQMKMQGLPVQEVKGEELQDLYYIVVETFQNPVYVIIYILSMAVIGYHLWHGFQSAFQTLGLQHKKYTPIIKFLGKVYSIVIPAAFAYIPIYIYFFK